MKIKTVHGSMLPVLCVEDDKNDRLLLEMALQEAGHRDDVKFVYDGREALDYLEGKGKYGDRAQYPLPALILLDLNLPYLRGEDVLAWIRSQAGHRRRVVVACSSSKAPQDVNLLFERGVNAFVCKPLTLEERLDFVRMLFSFWFEWNEFPGEVAVPEAQEAPAQDRDPHPHSMPVRQADVPARPSSTEGRRKSVEG